MKRKNVGAKKSAKKKKRLPIKHWSHSSLMAFLRNPLAWYKRYVEEIYDTPTTPAAGVGIQKGLEYVRSIGDFEINFGRAKARKARKGKRLAMEKEYLQAISYYLARSPRHKVLGVEVRGVVEVEGLP